MKRNIHDCPITMGERLVSVAMDAHFMIYNCAGTLKNISPVDYLHGNGFVQQFYCKKCNTVLTANFHNDKETD